MAATRPYAIRNASGDLVGIEVQRATDEAAE